MRKTFGRFGQIPASDAYDAVITGIESGDYASCAVESGAKWEAAWKAADLGDVEAFCGVIAFDHDGDEGQPTALTDSAIQKGFETLADTYPHLYQEIFEGDCDAISGDALMQCIVFGNVVYG